MARPRVFVSSTFYDLSQVRWELERFIKSMGYEAVLNERGAIPYGSSEKLEAYCYKEVQICDILISIIGGRFGSSSANDPDCSVSRAELTTAHSNGKQVYIFISKNVNAEYQTYARNKEIIMDYAHVDDKRIFQYIEFIYGLGLNNTIHLFESTTEIIDFLREQWAGLFQRLLNEERVQREMNTIEELRSSVNSLHEIAKIMHNTNSVSSEAIDQIVMANHPVFDALRSLLRNKYRVFFVNKIEMDQWLIAKGYRATEEFMTTDENYYEYYLRNRVVSQPEQVLVFKDLFDVDGSLRNLKQGQWNSSWVKGFTPKTAAKDDDDEIPF